MSIVEEDLADDLSHRHTLKEDGSNLDPNCIYTLIGGSSQMNHFLTILHGKLKDEATLSKINFCNVITDLYRKDFQKIDVIDIKKQFQPLKLTDDDFTILEGLIRKASIESKIFKG